MANALEIIIKDHRKVESQYEDYKNASPEEKEGSAREIFDLLELHAEMEEKLFYPELRKEFPETDYKRLERALTEHAEVKETIENLKRNDTSVKSFDTEMRTLMRAVERHVKEEESTLLPEAEEFLGEERLEEIGARMEKMRMRA
jgi:hemerythrin superfamily protein